jgi:HdeA/HdeB family
MRVVRAALAAFPLLVSPAFAADDTLPLAGMTCQQFLDSSKADTILTWMMGYMQDADQPAVIDLGKRRELGDKLRGYCKQNPKHAVMSALDNVTDEADSSDLLKSIAGTWRFPDRDVWVVVNPDGTAKQCRIAPDRSVISSKGKFQAPDILAWDQIWGEDKVAHGKDAITLTGKFGSFTYKSDSGPLSASCPSG